MGKRVCGVQEDLKKSPAFKPAPGDAGLIIKGLSAGGTAFAIGAATYFEDWEFRYQMLRTAEIAGGTKKQIKASVMYESLWLSMIGIPLGLILGTLIGYIGVRITGRFVSDINDIASIALKNICNDIQSLRTQLIRGGVNISELLICIDFRNR